MKYLFQICDAKDNPDRDGRRPAVGEFIMEATSEMDALTNFHKTPEYHKVMDTIPDHVKRDAIFHVENNYVKNMDVTAKINITTSFDLKPEDLKCIRGCDLALTSNDRDMIYHRGKNYLRHDSLAITQTGPRSFEATVSLYGDKNTDSVIRIPEYECVDRIPIYGMPDTFTNRIDSIMITVTDRNVKKAKEMEAFGEPAHINRDGHAVYEITFDKDLIKDPRFSIEDEQSFAEESFSEAVAGIPTEESGQSL